MTFACFTKIVTCIKKQWDSRQQLDDSKTKASLISPGVLSHRIRIKSDSVHVKHEKDLSAEEALIWFRVSTWGEFFFKKDPFFPRSDNEICK